MKNKSIKPQKTIINPPLNSYNAFKGVVEKYKKRTGEKMTIVKAVTAALDFFSENSMLPHEFKSYDTQKKLSSVEENVLKTKNQTLGFLKTFEKEILEKLNLKDSKNIDKKQNEFNITSDELLIYLYKKNIIIEERLQILSWLVLKNIENSEIEDNEFKSIIDEYKLKTKNIGIKAKKN